MEKLNCRACADLLADYLSGELDAEVRASFEVHLDRCRNCRTYLEQYAAVINAGQRACSEENEAAARAIPEELVRAILDARAEGVDQLIRLKTSGHLLVLRPARARACGRSRTTARR